MDNLPVEVQMAVIANSMNNLVTLLDHHTSQDMTQFNKLDEKLDEMMVAITALQIKLATDSGMAQGEASVIKRQSTIISGVVSTVISIIGLFAAVHWR